jgi:hypothetical protein
MAGLQPTVDILELFALQLPKEKFSGLLVSFFLSLNETIAKVTKLTLFSKNSRI